MTHTQAVANTFLYCAFKEDIVVTPMKLQKLTYFLFREFAKETGEPLFSERFEVWKHGPVLPSIFYEFQSFGKEKITKFAKNAQGKVQILDLNSNRVLFECFNKIWIKYKRYSGSELSNITHQPGSAWCKAKEKKCSTLEFEDIINDDEYILRA